MSGLWISQATLFEGEDDDDVEDDDEVDDVLDAVLDAVDFSGAEDEDDVDDVDFLLSERLSVR